MARRLVTLLSFPVSASYPLANIKISTEQQDAYTRSTAVSHLLARAIRLSTGGRWLIENFFVNWYKTQGRHFPWRQEGVSPFSLLITEMLLRQTQAVAVAKIWKQFIQRYPDAK